jgi:hypothetical protein
MARLTATNFAGGLQFPYATAATDLFKKEDVQTMALAVDQHDHSSGKGLVLPAGAIPSGLITSAMIADGTIVAGDIATGTITYAQLAAGAATATTSTPGSVSNPSTTSGSFADIPDMTVTLGTVGGPLMCWITIELQTDTTGSGGVLAFNLDGTDGPAYHLRFGNAGLPLPFTIIHIFGASAASHTIKARWAVLVSGTLTNPGQSRVMMLQEIRR